MITDNPVALRSDPYTRFDGPFLRAKGMYPIVAVFDDEVRFWREDGYIDGYDNEIDLVPLQVRPAARKWVRYLLTRAWLGRSEYIPMIERAPVDALVEALRQIAREPWILQGPIARDALAAWEAGL